MFYILVLVWVGLLRLSGVVKDGLVVFWLNDGVWIGLVGWFIDFRLRIRVR